MSNNNILKCLALAACLTLTGVTASYAYDFESDGIYYDITSSKEVGVTYKNTDYNSYSGDIVIPSTVRYNSKTYTVTSIRGYAFYKCTSLTSIDLPDGVTSIKYGAFEDCASLTNIVIPDAVTSIEDYTFYNCTSLTSIDLPDGLTSIGSYAFYYCTSLVSIDLPDGLTSIGYRAFQSCKSLVSIDLPNGVMSIEDEAFSGCTSLVSIDLPDGLTSIWDEAFSGCTSLTDVYSLNVTPPTCSNSYVFSTTTYNNATLHVPSEALTNYQTTSPWSKFDNIVGDATTGIEDVSISEEYSIGTSNGTITVTGVSGTVSVYGMNGVKVAEATADGGTTLLDIPQRGIYIVKVSDGKSSAAQKVTVQ